MSKAATIRKAGEVGPRAAFFSFLGRTDSEIASAGVQDNCRPSQVGTGVLFAYGAGALVDAVTSTALGTFLLFYLTAVCGLSNSLAGLSLFIGLIASASANIIVGSVSDNTRSRLGRRHPFMIGAPIPSAIIIILLFSIPVGVAGWPLFAYASAAYVGVRLFNSLYVLPHTAMGAELTDDYNERSRVIAVRTLFGCTGMVACLTLGTRLVMGGSGGLVSRHAYMQFGWICAAVVVATGLAGSFGTLRAIKHMPVAKARPGSAATRLMRALVEIFHNRSFVILFAVMLSVGIGAGSSGVLLMHVLKFFWGLPVTAIQLVVVSGTVGSFVGIAANLLFLHRLEKRSVVLYGMWALCILTAITPLLKIGGLLPAGGPPLYAALVLIFGSLGMISTCFGIALNSSTADVADEHEHLFGTRCEGLLFAVLSFAVTAAAGLGSLVAGVGLDLIRFPTNLAAGGAHLLIDPITTRNLGILDGPGPAFFLAIGAMIFTRYRLNRRAHAKIQVELIERRESAAMP